MAQTGYTPIQLYYSTTASAVPTNTNLANGELAINITDGKLYYKDNTGTVKLLTSTGSEISPITNNGVVYINGSGQATSGSALTFNGTSLGIGSSSYGDAGTITASIGVAGTTAGGLQLWASSAQEHFIQWGDATTGSATYAGAISYSHASDFMRFWTNSTEQMRLTSTGLGIGTSSPAYKLHAVKTGGGIVGRFDNADGVADIYGYGLEVTRSIAYIKGSGALHLGSAAGYSAVILDSAGNLGLGVTPGTWSDGKVIEINTAGNALWGESNYTVLLQNARYNGGYKYARTGVASSHYDLDGGSHKWYTAPSGTAGDAITFTQAMTLDASGRLLVGNTSAIGNAYIQSRSTNNTTISGNYVWNASDQGIYLRNDSNTNGTGVGLTMYGGSSANSVGAIYMVQETANALGALAFYTGGGNLASPYAYERARISSAGGFSVGTTADPGAGAIYATGNITAYYSDDRLKTRLGNIENALDKVDQLQGFYYEANETAQALGYKPKREVGVSAQSVQAVLPEIVSPAPIDQQYLTLDYERLVPLLIEAVKELRAEVKALKGV